MLGKETTCCILTDTSNQKWYSSLIGLEGLGSSKTLLVDDACRVLRERARIEEETLHMQHIGVAGLILQTYEQVGLGGPGRYERNISLCGSESTVQMTRYGPMGL